MEKWFTWLTGQVGGSLSRIVLRASKRSGPALDMGTYLHIYMESRSQLSGLPGQPCFLKNVFINHAFDNKQHFLSPSVKTSVLQLFVQLQHCPIKWMIWPIFPNVLDHSSLMFTFVHFAPELQV